MGEVQNIQQILFTHLQLLGLDPSNVEKQHRIPCNREMFNLPNKKGFEAIMHFLFVRLNPTKSKEVFRDCWPVTDKKQEQQFRKVCNAWLLEIAKEDDSCLPRVNPSLLMSPGGERFYQLLFAFSSYVLLKCIQNDNGVKNRDILRRPTLSPQTQNLGPVMARTIMSSGVRQREEYMEHMQQNVSIQTEWRQYMSELVKTYRAVSKSIRELERKLQLEIQRRTNAMATKQSCPNPHKAASSGYDQELENVQRSHQVQRVRALWRRVHEITRDNPEREVMTSLLEGGEDATCRLDAAQLCVRVPDLLLRTCEREIQRRNVQNIYEGGKLNLLSLIHLWNLSLHMYIEKLQSVGLPNFKEDLGLIESHVTTHNAHLGNAQALREHLEMEVIPDLKRSISVLSSSLDRHNDVITPFQHNDLLSTVNSLNQDLYQVVHLKLLQKRKSLGFGLMPPTPPLSFDPTDAQTPADVAMATRQHINTQSLTTPEAAEELMDDLKDKVKPVNHVTQATPLFAPRPHPSRVRTNLNEANRIPERKSTRTTKTNGTGQHPGTKPLKSQATNRPNQVKSASSLTSKSSRDKAQVTSRNSAAKHQPVKSVSHGSKKKRTSPTIQPRVERHMGPGHGVTAIPSHAKELYDSQDDLAGKLVSELLDASSPREVIGAHSSPDVPSTLATSRTDAFTHGDLLTRTPPSHHTQSSQWHDALTQNSYGPLSSTSVEEKFSNTDRYNKEKVAARLFNNSDDEEEDAIVTIAAHDKQEQQYPSNHQSATDVVHRNQIQEKETCNASPYVHDQTPVKIMSSPHLHMQIEASHHGEEHAQNHQINTSFFDRRATPAKAANSSFEHDSFSRNQILSVHSPSSRRLETYGAESDHSDHVVSSSTANQNKDTDTVKKFRLSMDAFELRYREKEMRKYSDVSKSACDVINEGRGQEIDTTHMTSEILQSNISPSNDNMKNVLNKLSEDKSAGICSELSENLAELAATATPIIQKHSSRINSAVKVENHIHYQTNLPNPVKTSSGSFIEDTDVLRTSREQMDLRKHSTMAPLESQEPDVEDLLGGSFSLPQYISPTMSRDLLGLSPSGDLSGTFSRTDVLRAKDLLTLSTSEQLSKSKTQQRETDYYVHTSPLSSHNLSKSVPFHLRLRETPDSKTLKNVQIAGENFNRQLGHKEDILSDNEGFEGDVVKAIEFENGNFNEVHEISPAKLRTSSGNVKSNQSSPFNSSHTASRSIAMDTETDNLINRYRKIRLATQGEENSTIVTVQSPFSATRQSPDNSCQSDSPSQSDSLYSRLSSISKASSQTNAGRKFTLDFEDEDGLLGSNNTLQASARHHGEGDSVLRQSNDTLLGNSAFAWTSPATARVADTSRKVKYLPASQHSNSPQNSQFSINSLGGSPRDKMKLGLHTVPLSQLTGALHADPLTSTMQGVTSLTHGMTSETTPASHQRLSTDHIHDIFGNI